MSCDPKYFRERVFTFAKERLRKLYEDLKELDSRFSYDDGLGYIRFITAQGASEYVVSRTYSETQAKILAKRRA